MAKSSGTTRPFKSDVAWARGVLQARQTGYKPRGGAVRRARNILRQAGKRR